MMFFNASRTHLVVCRRSLLMAFVVGIFTGLSEVRADAPSVEGSMPEDYLPGLKPILETALKQAPQMILSEITLVQAEAARITQNAQRYPNLGGTLQYTNGRSATSGSPSSADNGVLYNIGVSQSIFQWGALRNQSEIARIGVLVAQKFHAEAYRLLAASLRAQYMALIVKKGSLIGLKYRLKMSEGTLEVERQKFKNGAISQGELVGPELNLEEGRLVVDRAEQDYDQSLRLFARLTGYAGLNDSLIPTEISKPVFSSDKSESLIALLRRDNAESTFTAQVAALNVRSAELNYKIARVRLLPKVYVNAGVSQVNSTTATGNGTKPTTTAINSQSAAVVASWTIFDGFATRGAKMSALASKRYSERTLQNQLQLTLEAAQSLQKSLAINARALDLSDRRRELAEGAMNRVKDEFKLGNISQMTVDETTSAYFLSQTSLAAARAEFLARWSEFVSLIGIDPAMNYLPARYAH